MTVITTQHRTIPTPPERTYGPTLLDVSQYNVDATGASDTTAAFQAVIDALPKSGGTVHAPAGTYLIDPVVKLQLRSNMRLLLDAGAVLKAKPNGAIRYNILSLRGINNVLIEGGGTLQGDRDSHTFTPQPVKSQNTHEWGHGMGIYGSSQITLRNITIRDCTGDGASISDSNVDGVPGDEHCVDILIKDCHSLNNRRQGYSIGKADTVVIQGGTIDHINGTNPQDGIDIEPEAGGAAKNIFIDDVMITNCVHNGIETNAWRSPIEGVQVTNCSIINNGAGTYFGSGDQIELSGNTITDNNGSGTYFGGGVTNAYVSENTYARNYDRGNPVTKDRADFTQVGASKQVEADILNRATDPSVVIGRNYFQ